jgi:hypothetical protein
MPAHFAMVVFTRPTEDIPFDVKMGKALINGEYLLKKFPGKGGWTYAEIPEVLLDKSMPFGWVKVKGRIDSYELSHYKLMPMGNGKLFLPVKATIRKQLDKQAGDMVHIELYHDDSPVSIPEEIIDCLRNESEQAYTNFKGFTEGEQKAYLDWIYSAKKEETKAERIVKMIERVLLKVKFYDKLLLILFLF